MWKELMESFSDRVRNPFFSYFILSWLAWNWKLALYILFQDSDMSVTSKISYIEETYASWGYNFIYPFLTALAFFVLYQYLSMATIWFWSNMRTRHRNIQIKASEEDLLKKQAKEKKILEEEINRSTQNEKLLDKERELLKTELTNLKKSNEDQKVRFDTCRKTNIDLKILYQVYSLAGLKENDSLRFEIYKFCRNYFDLENDGLPTETFNNLKQIIDNFAKNKKFKIFDQLYDIFKYIIKGEECHIKTKKVFDIMSEYKRA